MVGEIVVRFEHAVREPIVAHELADVLDRIEFMVIVAGTTRRVLIDTLG
jgi:hypothetical protein